MKVYPISNSLIDVFLHDGWENWSRWSKSRDGYIKQVGGKDVSGFVKNLIIKKLSEGKDKK